MKKFTKLATLNLVLLATAAAAPPTPPKQPADGPGGATYAHATVKQKSYGDGGAQYWLFEPSSPEPTSAPVVVFLHGWMAMEPHVYGAWIKHIVRRGNIVIYPRYQAGVFSSLDDFTPNAVAAVKAALCELQTGQHVRPETNRVAVVGHSMGGALTPNLAALAAKEGLPQPAVLMSVEPGNGPHGHPAVSMTMADMSRIPASTLLLVVVGEDDSLVADHLGKRIFRETTQITSGNKNLIKLLTDRHGEPSLLAGHFAPLAIDNSIGTPSFVRVMQWLNLGVSDALDYYGFWKFFDALCDAAFRGTNRETALGNTASQCFMGRWSDGVPVKEPVVTTQP